jgi:hypothetical protein
MQTDTHLRRIINDSSRLQYTIELAKRRMSSSVLSYPNSQRSYSQRLFALRTREKNWRNLTYKKLQTIKLPNTGQVYEFMGGVYGNGREEDQKITGSIAFYDLPRLDGSPSELEPWIHTMYDLSIIDFTMDPEQDLLLLVSLAPSTYVQYSCGIPCSQLATGPSVCISSTYALSRPTNPTQKQTLPS